MRTTHSVSFLIPFIWPLIHDALGSSPITTSDEQDTKARSSARLLFTPDVTPSQRAISEGYPAENHSVTTEDGYILELHRIPFGIKGEQKAPIPGQPRPVVLLMHCMMCASLDWLLNYPDKALGFILADEGYDVWMMNGRGNPYSRKHVSLSPKTREFWLFSYHEIAALDMPASIDYILSVTGQTKLSYVGFSMGSQVLYALMDERPEYNDKINIAAILGPAAYLTHSRGSVFQYSGLVNILERVTDMFGIWELPKQGPVKNLVATTLCDKRNFFFRELCMALYSNLIEIDEEFMNEDFLPLILWKTPAGGSLRTIFHLWQNKNTDRFLKYSYGRKGNLRVYGTTQPPAYNFTKTTIPIGFFAAEGDKYVVMEDVERLENELPNVVMKHVIKNKNFSHFDFLWANDARDILYKYVIKLLKAYQS